MIIMLIVEKNFTSKFSEVSKKVIFIFPSYIYKKKKNISEFFHTRIVSWIAYIHVFVLGGFFGTFPTQIMTF